MDLPGLVTYLRTLQSVAAQAAAPAATAMGEKMQDEVRWELHLISHPPGMFWKATAGRPPAYASGALSRSVGVTPGSGLVRASALVGVYAVYARIQEEGGYTWPSRSRFMKWTNSRGTWYKKRVEIPAHPYFRPALERGVSSGSLSRAARDAFWSRLSPFMG